MNEDKKISVVFFGTPEFSLPFLQELAESEKFDIRLVVTQPDRPAGRGKKPTHPPVKKLAAQLLELPCYQPDRIKEQKVIDKIKSVRADVGVVVAYGQIIPPALLDAFPLGVINAHPSLLPKYRGAAPIQRAILAGEEKTGVTIMLLDEGLDSGPILAQEEIRIAPNETAGSLHDRLATLGSALLRKTLIDWASGAIKPVPQNHSIATYAEPIKKEELNINWQRRADEIVRTIRAFDPWPGAHTFWQGRRLKCYGGHIASVQLMGISPGKVVRLTEDGLLIGTGDGNLVSVSSLQLEGRRKVSAEEFVRGKPNIIGAILG